jgi:hypothetical protein
MLHPFPASRPRPIALAVAVTTVALLALAWSPASASAECLSSTFESRLFSDGAISDAQPGAPEIRFVDATIDWDCQLTIDPTLAAALGPNQYLSILLGFDPSTGNPDTETYDLEILVEPGFAPALLDDIGGIAAELSAFGEAGFTAHLDELGVPPGVNLGVALIGLYDPSPADGDEALDFAPNIDQLMYRLPIDYETPAPPPPPPPPPLPAAAPAATPAAPAAKQVTGCLVPRLKGLSVRKAKAALKKAGCKYKLKGKGRVRSFSPKAGTRTNATVQVKCKPKKRKRKRGSRRSSLSQHPALAAGPRSG